MNISKEGVNLIKKLEGLRLSSYLDGGGVWTIGYGHTKDVKKGQKISEKKAQTFLVQDLDWAQAAVNLNLTTKVSQNQFDALVSFTYNLGATAFKESWVLKYTNELKLNLVREQFMRFVYDNGVLVTGLAKRRQQEADFYDLGVSQYRQNILEKEIEENSKNWKHHKEQMTKLHKRNNELRELMKSV